MSSKTKLLPQANFIKALDFLRKTIQYSITPYLSSNTPLASLQLNKTKYLSFIIETLETFIYICIIIMSIFMQIAFDH
jgi:hypothetical protein